MKRYMKSISASSNMTIYEIPTKWEMQSLVPVPARSLEEAIDIITRRDCPVPKGEYVESTFEIDYDRLKK